MINQHISLESLYVSERIERIYAQIIAQEDMEDSYGKEAILLQGIYPTWQHIF